jgi:hypothetical protein
MEETNMKSAFFLTAIFSICLFAMGCENGIGNPFAGAQFDVGDHHLSFSHAVADWDTANDRLVLKFDLLSGSSYPTATVTVENVSTIEANVQRAVTVDVAVSANTSYKSASNIPNANAMITFSQFDLGPVGAVSGTNSGAAQSVQNPSDTPVDLTADFQDVLISN